METAHAGWWNPKKLLPFWAASLLIVAAILLPHLSRSRVAVEESTGLSGRMEQTKTPAASPMPAKMAESVVRSISGGDQDRLLPAEARTNAADFGRKLIRSSSLEVLVKDPIAIARQIENVAQQLGGFVESSEILGTKDDSSASIVIRVPAARLQEAETKIGGLVVRIENERTTVTDSTRDYVDREARLRNLQAEEAQYLAIMKSASHVKDMLAVTEKLSEVRGEIEQEQAEFAALSRQVETASLKIELHTEVDTQVLGLHWRPLYQLKVAIRDGVDSMASYATTMLGLIFQLPALALWLATLLSAAILTWRALKWSWRRFFSRPDHAPALNSAT